MPGDLTAPRQWQQKDVLSGNRWNGKGREEERWFSHAKFLVSRSWGGLRESELFIHLIDASPSPHATENGQQEKKFTHPRVEASLKTIRRLSYPEPGKTTEASYYIVCLVNGERTLVSIATPTFFSDS